MSSFTFIVNFLRIFPCRIGLMSLPDWSYVIAGLDPAISPAKGIPASERGNDIVSHKSKLGLKQQMGYKIRVILNLIQHPLTTREPES